MANVTSLKTDIKMIMREPILILFFTLPIFIPIVFKLGITNLTPVINDYFRLDLAEYYGYILTFSILMTPLMLGTVTGFLMIDEKDSRIQELIQITPIGYGGYILNRLMMPFIISIVYTFATYFILGIHYVDLLVLLLICFLVGIQGILIGYLLYSLATDKVQGLTYAKGFGVFNFFALADIFDITWFSIIAGFTPFYWITKLVVDFSLYTAFIAITIHIIYLLVIIRRHKG